jgi:hypothetical protein
MIITLARSFDDILALDGDASPLDNITANALAGLETLANSPEFSLIFQDVWTSIGTATKVILKDNTTGAGRQEELRAYLPDADGNPPKKTMIRRDYNLITSEVYAYLKRTGFAEPSYRLELPDPEELPRQDDGASLLRFKSPFIH